MAANPQPQAKKRAQTVGVESARCALQSDFKAASAATFCRRPEAR